MDESKILITGANGQLGKALQEKYPTAQKADHNTLDVTNKENLLTYNWSSVKYILNAAAYTDVDGAEANEGRISAWKVNAQGASHLAEVASKKDITLVHVSTDYVFDGTIKVHTESEALSPLSAYGASKAAGDIAVTLSPKHYILRTSWLIGEGRNFVRTMLELGKKGVNPTVVADQIGRLTFTSELVKAIDLLLKNNPEHGVYNISNGGEPASWADITKEIFKNADYNLQVTNTTTENYYAGKDNIAPRPLNSVLDLSKLESVGFVLRDWRENLKAYVQKETEEK